MTKLTFEKWFGQVNLAISNRIGLTADDLPDMCWRDWYDDGYSPEEAAAEALEEAGADF